MGDNLNSCRFKEGMWIITASIKNIDAQDSEKQTLLESPFGLDDYYFHEYETSHIQCQY